MADKDLSQQEKQRLKEKEKFERERKKWKQQESKKRVRKSGKKDRGPALFKLLAVVVAAAIVLGIASIFTSAYGVPGRYMPALTVGSQNIDAPVWAFSFYNMYHNMYAYGMYYGIDTGASLFGQPMLEEDGSSTTTWDAYFRRTINQSLQNEFAIYAEAQKAGFKLDQEALDALDQEMAKLKTTAMGAAMSVGAYLRNAYVAGITERKFRALQERMLVVQGFSAQKREEFRANHPDDELQAAYDEDPTAYHQVDFRIYAFAKDGEGPADLAVRQAEEFLAAGTEEGFIAAAQKRYDDEHQHEEDEELDHEHDYDADAATLSPRRNKAYITNTYGDEGFADWFFDAARKAGDSTTWETDSSVYAVYLVRPAYAQATVDLYSIIFDVATDAPTPGEGEPTAQEKAKQSADDLLAKWQKDGGTKEDFMALKGAELTEKAAPGDAGIAELDSWLFDAARKAGEATVIETPAGCMVVYLSSLNEDNFVWQREIADKFMEEDYAAYVQDLQQQPQYALGYHGIGNRYAMRYAQKMCDAYMESMKDYMANQYGMDYYDYY